MAPVESLITDAGKELISTGVLGTLLVGVVGIWGLREWAWEKKLAAVQDRLYDLLEKRHKQNEDTIKALEASAEAMRSTLEYQREARRS